MNPAAIIGLLIGMKQLYDQANQLYSDFQKEIDASISAGDLHLESLQETIEKLKNEGLISRDFELPKK